MITEGKLHFHASNETFIKLRKSTFLEKLSDIDNNLCRISCFLAKKLTTYYMFNVLLTVSGDSFAIFCSSFHIYRSVKLDTFCLQTVLFVPRKGGAV